MKGISQAALLLTLGACSESPPGERFSVVPLSNIAQVSAGLWHQCALSTKGEVACWGQNVHGQVGQPASDDEFPWAVTVPELDEVTSVSAGGGQSCAITKDGSLWCWGSANELSPALIESGVPGQSPFLVRLTKKAIDVSVGLAHTCVLLEDSSVQCWGGDDNGQAGGLNRGPCQASDSVAKFCVREPSTVVSSGATEVAAGSLHTCALVGDGAQCWGDEYLNGQPDVELGAVPCLEGSADCAGTPMSVPSVQGAQHLASGSRHACATGTGGTFCWGHNDRSRTGDTEGPGPGPYRIAIDGIGVAVTADYSCAVQQDGRVACWGGVLRGPPVSGGSPIVIQGLENVIALSGNQWNMCALREDGTVLRVGSAGDMSTLATEPITTRAPVEADSTKN